ncbi:hypothetical protein V6N11_003564 [Hibiscus sabdariffa]|uniref:Uncharacterized protein n=1 Tax=Hibiscus sabdariffa TaxID=183260 RepID=A0ABR2SDN8_9ROSI
MSEIKDLYGTKVKIPMIFLQVLQLLSQNCCLPLPELKNKIDTMRKVGSKMQHYENSVWKVGNVELRTHISVEA